MQLRIYYEDTDCGGVVYHSNYLKYMERSRTELLRDLDIDLKKYHDEGTVFAITEAALKFRFPAKYNDLLTIESTVIELTSYRMTFRSKIFNQHGQLCCRGDVKMVAVNEETGKVTQIDDNFYEKLQKCITEGD